MPETLAPPVTVLMSVYNGEPYIREAVESILNQTFADFEFVIVDDASVDDTENILDSYDDCRIVRIRNRENIGLTKSLNGGLRIARGQFVARQDADDVSLPERLEKQIAFLQPNPATVLVASNLRYIDHEGRSIGRSARVGDRDLVAWYLMFHNHLGGHSQVVFRRSSVVNVGGYCESKPYSQDYELWTRLLRVGHLVILPEVLLLSRLHDKQISITATLAQRESALATSGQYISSVIGEELSPELVAELSDFWVAGLPGNQRLFPEDGRRSKEIQIVVKRIYEAFLQHQKRRYPGQAYPARKLRSLISRQFLSWGMIVSTIRRPLIKLRLSLYALRWDALGALHFFLGKLKRNLKNSLKVDSH